LALLNHSYVSQIKSVDVLKAFIARIDEINPITNCVVDERFLEALKEAQEADELVASGAMTEKELSEKKPFLGVPISTKDCIRVEGLLNTSGLYHRKNFRAEEDSQVMKQMREAGAIPFALTNVTELCFWWETVNCVHGRTLNPYDTNRSVGGSSEVKVPFRLQPELPLALALTLLDRSECLHSSTGYSVIDQRDLLSAMRELILLSTMRIKTA
jgi:Asp-tRNA(Asn)/Glu-tRNA(Gln) amidotransferase A subunit family amidase